jgi:hypothetical protein
MVYVDSARNKLGRMKMAHMTADTVPELVIFAFGLGLKTTWLQTPRTRPHFDLCQEKREQAIQRGAKVVTSKELVRIARVAGTRP